MRPEPVGLPESLFDPAPGPRPFWPRLGRAVAMLGVGALAHSLLPADAMLPPLGILPPPPALAQAAQPGSDRIVLVERSTVFAPIAPGLPEPPARSASSRRAAAPAAPDRLEAVALRPADRPVSLAGLSVLSVDVPASIGTSGDAAALSFPRSARPQNVRSTKGASVARAIDGGSRAGSGAGDPATEPARAGAVIDDGNSGLATDDVDRPERAARAAAITAATRETAAAVDDEDLVLQLLKEFTGAFERLDVRATKAVWPSVDDRKLKRAYAQLSSQQLSLQSCGITISGQTANARCQGSATYQPKIGTRAVEIASREWMFSLAKQDARWHIESLIANP